MSAQINCDRCGNDTNGRFLNAKLDVRRGVFASVYSKISPAVPWLPWQKNWHLCEACNEQLRRWSERGTRVVYEAEDAALKAPEAR